MRFIICFLKLGLILILYGCSHRVYYSNVDIRPNYNIGFFGPSKELLKFNNSKKRIRLKCIVELPNEDIVREKLDKRFRLYLHDEPKRVGNIWKDCPEDSINELYEKMDKNKFSLFVEIECLIKDLYYDELNKIDDSTGIWQSVVPCTHPNNYPSYIIYQSKILRSYILKKHIFIKNNIKIK